MIQQKHRGYTTYLGHIKLAVFFFFIKKKTIERVNRNSEFIIFIDIINFRTEK